MAKQKVAMLTAGGLAPCLSSAVGGLIERYGELAPELELIGYTDGYKGLLLGENISISAEGRAKAHLLHGYGGSPLGNSRVKLTNVADCVKRGLVKEGEDPLAVAAKQLQKDGVAILHSIGGDDTNTMAAQLARYLGERGVTLTVVGLPKTVDNDVRPIRQSLGAWTAAEQGARFFANIVNERSANPRMLVVHEVMGRHSGWLAAATAKLYREWLLSRTFARQLGMAQEQLDIDAVYLPELPVDLAAEATRLKERMDKKGNVNLFISEGAGVDAIVKQLESSGESVPKDAFGHVKLDKVNVGSWFAAQLGKALGAEKTLVQKSGYFARSAAANLQDLMLIKSMVDLAVDCGLRGEGGVIGHDEERGGVLRAIEFERIGGGKPFDTKTEWFSQILDAIGQPH